MRAVVTGGRDYEDFVLATHFLGHFCSLLGVMKIAHGKARGADTLADDFCKAMKIPVVPFPAEWKGPDGRTNKSAGLIRNRRMFDQFQPQVCFALPGGTGTANMVQICLKGRVPVVRLVEGTYSEHHVVMQVNHMDGRKGNEFFELTVRNRLS